jgi:hypothetical protein
MPTKMERCEQSVEWAMPGTNQETIKILIRRICYGCCNLRDISLSPF